jgi:large subunit ribosomal protein L25
MSSVLSLQAQVREKTGKGSARTLRRAGKIPAIIYGKGHKEVLITLNQHEVQNLQGKFTFVSTPIEIDLEGKKHRVLPKSVLLHPVTDKVEHADFVFLNKGEKVRVKVPVLFTGKDKSMGLKRGGVLNIVLRNIELLVDTDNIPNVIEIDVAKLEIGEAVHLKDIALPKGAKSTIQDPNYTIAKVVGKKAMKLDEEATTAEATGDKAEDDKDSKDKDSKDNKDKDNKSK